MKTIRSTTAVTLILALGIAGILSIILSSSVHAGQVWPDTLKAHDTANYALVGTKTRIVHQKGDTTAIVVDSVMLRKFRLEQRGDSVHVVCKSLDDLVPFFDLVFKDSSGVAWRRYIKRVDTLNADGTPEVKYQPKAKK